MPKSLLSTLFVLAVAVFASTGASSGKDRAESPAASPVQADETKVIAYYFHLTARCVTCRAIEAYSREVIEQRFGGDIASGRLQFKLVNVQFKENRHFVKDFELVGQGLVLVEMRGGRPGRWVNLPKIWDLFNDEPAFRAYVRSEAAAFLKGS